MSFHAMDLVSKPVYDPDRLTQYVDGLV